MDKHSCSCLPAKAHDDAVYEPLAQQVVGSLLSASYRAYTLTKDIV